MPMYTKANDVWLSLNGEHVHTFKVEYSLLSQLQSMFLFANTTTTNVTGRTKDYVTKHSLLNRPMRCFHFDKYTGSHVLKQDCVGIVKQQQR